MSTDLPDLYAVLGLPRTATGSEIRARYRELIKEERPEKFAGERSRASNSGDHERVEQLDARMALAQERSRLLRLAHEILSNPRKRQQYDRGETVRQVPRPPLSPLEKLHREPDPDDPPRLVFDQTSIDFGVVEKNESLRQTLKISNLGGIPSDFAVDWEQPVPWASFEVTQDPDDMFPATVDIQIETGELNYGRYRLRLAFTVEEKTVTLPVSFDLHGPAVRTRRPASSTYAPPTPEPRTREQKSSGTLKFIIGPALVVIAALIICPLIITAIWQENSGIPREDAATLTAFAESYVSPTARRTARPTSRPTETGEFSGVIVVEPESATPDTITVGEPPTATSTARAIEVGIPAGWQAVSADVIADDANWRPIPRTPFVMGGDAKLIHNGNTITWVLPAWVAHDWWLTLNPSGEGEDQLISARIQVISGEPLRYGLVTTYEDETHHKIFVIDRAANTYAISRLFGSSGQRAGGNVLPESIDPNNMHMAVLMADGHSTFMLDGEVVFESDTLTTDGRVGFYAMVAPYSKVTLSIDNVVIATP